MVSPRVTTRALIDPSRKCSLRCEFCYYLPNNDLFTVQDWDKQKQQVIDARNRGCDCCDISGGEPLQNPSVVELVEYCTIAKLPARIITSLICAEKTLDSVLDAGVADWLISMHGAKAETHNEIVAVPKARQLQIRRLMKIADRMDYCCNYVMVEKNQDQMADWAKWLVALDRKPKVCNFINFNAFGPWLQSHEWIEKGKLNVIDIRISTPILDEAIDILEENGVGVNVRYYPMCGLAERHRKNVCNDLHVAFDFGEWDNGVGGNTLAIGENYGRSLSNRNELQTTPCIGCGVKNMCGGANRIWHQLAKEKFGVETLTQLAPVVGDYWHYRKDNTMGLDPRRSLSPST